MQVGHLPSGVAACGELLRHHQPILLGEAEHSAVSLMSVLARLATLDSLN